MIPLLVAIFLFFVPQIATAQVSISEIFPASPEWVELHNDSDIAITLTGWKFDDIESGGKSPKDLSSINIPASTYCVIELGSGYLNDGADSARLINNLNVQVDIFSYTSSSPDKSWAKQLDSTWTQGVPSKSSLCLIVTPTPTTPPPTPTAPTPTIPTPTTPPPTPTTPAPTSEPIHITIDNLPSSASLGNTFIIRFIVSHATPNTDYHIKAYGGINDNYYLETQNGTSWYGFNAAWDNLPKFKSDSSGNINQLLFVRAKTDKEIGNYRVQVKIRDPETISEIKYIAITKFVPSPTPTKIEPTPTTEFIPTPEPLPTNPPEVTPEPASVLGLSDQNDLSPNITPINNSKSSGNIIPIILISAGGILLLVPLLVSKIRNVKKI